MVVLVRCKDNSCSIALKSRLNELVNAGLVTAYLRNGEWLAVSSTKPRRVCKAAEQQTGICAPLAAPF